MKSNLERIRERMDKAASRSGRSGSDIILVAVTKTVSAETIRLLPELGIVDIGENRVQTALRKAGELPGVFRWHMIGHLQRNKVNKALTLFKMIHSIDSLRLAQTLEKEMENKERDSVELLVQVNVSGEETKSGIYPDEVERFFETLISLKRLKIMGLMTMAPFVDDPEKVRHCFAGLRRIKERLQDHFGERCPLPFLSMGMTQDFEVAIEEGANIIRIGTLLFQGIEG